VSAAVTGSAPARAALAGNPSDGYGGAVLAVTLAGWSACVELEPATRLRVEPPSELIAAAVRRFGGDERVAVRWSSSIPREVGLAGSSAIVTATLRALTVLHGVELAPDELAEHALAVEVEELGIAAGLQDRVAQAYGGLLLMDFGAGRYERLATALLPPLLIVHRVGSGQPSGRVHGDLRERHRRGERDVHAAMETLAEHARRASAALAAGDGAAFRECMSASLVQRRAIMALDPAQVALAEQARALGAGVNYAGSGGALVVAARDHGHRRELLGTLVRDGWQALPVEPGRELAPAPSALVASSRSPAARRRAPERST
jgi:glucuronokinase